MADDVSIRISGDVSSILAALNALNAAFTQTAAEIQRLAENQRRASAEIPKHFEDGAKSGALFGIQISRAFQLLVDGAGAAVRALPAVVVRAADVADSLRDMSRQTGISVEALSQLRFVASQTGVNLSVITRTIFEMGKRLQAGGDEIADAVDKLGLNIGALKAMKPEDAFVAIFEALSKIPDASERALRGTAIFGPRFRVMSQLAKEDIKGLMEQAQKLGLTISTETADQADKFNDSLDVMRKMIEATKNEIGFALLPALTTIAEAAPKAGGAVLLIGSSLLDVTKVMGGVAATLIPLTDGFGKVASWIGTLGNTVPILTARVWLLDVAQKAATIGAIALNVALAAVVITLAAVAAAAAIAYQAWKWYQEAQERRAAADRQASFDASNLVILNERLGTSYKTLAEATAEYYRRLKEGTITAAKAVDPFVKMAERTKAAEAELAKLTPTLRAQMAAAIEADEDNKVLVEALTQLGVKADQAELALKILRKQLEAEAKATKEAAKAAEEYLEAWNKAVISFVSAWDAWRVSVQKGRSVFDDWNRDVQRGLADAARQTTDTFKTLVDAYFGYQTKLQLAMKTGLSRTLAELDLQETAVLAELSKGAVLFQGLWFKTTEAVIAYFAEMRRIAKKDTGEFERDAELRGVKTKAVLEAILAEEEKWLAQMMANRDEVTDDAIEKQEEVVKGALRAAKGEESAWRGAFEGILSALDASANAFQRLAQIGNESLGKIAQGVSFAATMMGDIKGLLDAKDAIGAIIAAAKLAIDAIVGLWDALTTSPGEDVVKRVGREWGVTIGEELGNQIAETAKEVFGGSRAAAEIFHLADIIAVAGGVTARNFETMLGKLRDVFVMVETGRFTIEQARTVLDENFDLFAEHITKSGGLATASFLEILALNQRFGTESEAIADFITQQAGRVTAGFGAVAAAYTAPWIEASEEIKAGTDDLNKLRTKADELQGSISELAAISTLTPDQQKQLASWREGYQQITTRAAELKVKIAELQALPTLTSPQRAQLESWKLEYQALTGKAATLKLAIDELAKQDLSEKQIEQLAKLRDEYLKVTTQIGALESAQKQTVDQIGREGAPAFERMGKLAVLAFEAARGSGMTLAEALKSIKPSLDDLSQAQATFGFTAQGTYAELLKFGEFVSQNEELAGAIDGVNQMMSGLHNSGLLTEDAFGDLTATANDLFDRMVKGGLSGDQAMRFMQPTLQTVWALQKDFGYAVDDSTQKLIDQGVEAGVVGDKHRSAQDRAAIAMERTADILERIAQKMGVDLPAAAGRMADAMTVAADTGKAALVGEGGVGPAIDEVSAKLEGTSWEEWAARGGVAGDLASRGIERAAEATAEVQDQLDDTDWGGWADDAVRAARDAADAIDAVNYGKSPGGLKEIPLQLKRAHDAVRSWATNWMDQMNRARSAVDSLSLGSPSAGPGVAGVAEAAPGEPAAVGPGASMTLEIYALDPSTMHDVMRNQVMPKFMELLKTERGMATTLKQRLQLPATV